MTFRPVLRPGAPLLRRDATHLQIGTSPGTVIVDRPGLMAFLRLLDGARDAERLNVLARERLPELTEDVHDLLARLAAAGVVVDAAAAPVHTTYEIAIRTDPAAASLAGTIRSILSTSGLTRLDSTEPDLLVLVSCGEPARVVFEQAAMWRISHLPAVIDEDRVRVGPLAEPGVTPGVCCLDLHRADWDPAWPALLHQLGRPGSSVTGAGLAATTAHTAAAEIAVEILAHADGRRARTAGQCLLVGPGHDERTLRPVPFHPRCVCDLLRAA